MSREIRGCVVVLGFFQLMCVFSERRLCPAEWTRFSNKCYKMISHPPINTVDQAKGVCKQESIKSNLSIIVSVLANDFVTATLKDAGVNSTFIALNDIGYENDYGWDEYTDLDWDKWSRNDNSTEVYDLKARLDSGNILGIDCVETTDEGIWLPINCTAPNTRITTLCQQHIDRGDNGFICHLNGDVLVP